MTDMSNTLLQRFPVVGIFLLYALRVYRAKRMLYSIKSDASSFYYSKGDSSSAFEDMWVCVVPWPSMGDSYIVAHYLKKWAHSRVYAVVTSSERSREVLLNCGIGPVFVRSAKEVKRLVRLSYFAGEQESKVKVLHYGPKYSQQSINRFMIGFNALSFYDAIKYCVFPGIAPCDCLYPRYSHKNDSLPRHKTILMCPESTTLKITDCDFWRLLGESISGMGYRVVVNSKEPYKGMEDYETSFLELCDLGKVSDKYDAVIGVRSGLMDLLAKAPIPKIVIYPDEDVHDWGVGSPKEAWSLSNFSTGGRLDELVLISDNYGDLVREVVELIVNYYGADDFEDKLQWLH